MGSATYQGGKHLEFNKLHLEKGRKLHKYEVRNFVLGGIIGEIHWRGGWMQYVFQARPEIDMSRSCHKEIDKFIDKLMQEWRDKKRSKIYLEK